MTLVPALTDPFGQGFGILKNGPSLTEALLEERRRGQQLEQRKIEH